MNDEAPPLPDVFMTVLDREQAERILDDIEHHAELLQVMRKSAARDHADEPSADLALARCFLGDEAQRGLQLRYRFRGEVWTDTLMRLPSGKLRLVRMAMGSPSGLLPEAT